MNKFNKITQRLNKPVYKHLTKEEYKLKKLLEKKEQHEKYFYGANGFYATVKRKNNIVDWDSLSEKELDIFDYNHKELEKINSQISNLEDKYSINSEDVIDKFNKTQNSLSVSF